jgi:DNA modification methylase
VAKKDKEARKPVVVDQRYALVPVGDICPHPRNPRKGAVDAIDQSIAENGFYGAVIVQKSSSLILAGRHRWERAQAAGIATVPVIWVDVDDQAALRILAADNRTSDLAGYDPQALAELLESVRTESGGFEGTGYDEASFNEILAQAGDAILAANGGAPASQETEEPEVDQAEELLGKWSVEPGQIWKIGPHRLACGDSRSAELVARLMEGKKAQWIWTDPPYGVAYVGKTKDALTIQNDGADDLPGLLLAVFQQADTVLLPGAPFYIAHADKAVMEFRTAINAVGWHVHQALVWVKNSLVMGHCDYHAQHEPILYGWKEPSAQHWIGSMYPHRPWYGERDKTTLLNVDRPSRSATHPTIKPVELIKRCLENSSRVGFLGYEPFAGSGSTMVAAHESSRVCNAVELAPKYCAVILERMQKLGVEPKLAA